MDNQSQARKWWARFGSNGRRKDINRLLKNRAVCAGFDLLLPFIGLWDPFKTSQLERILGLRYPEVRKNSFSETISHLLLHLATIDT